MPLRCLVLIIAVFTLALFPKFVVAADVDNPDYLSWAGCKPGTTVTTKVTRSSGSEKTITYTLVSIDKDKAVTTNNVTGEETINAKISKEQADKAGDVVGEEDVKVADKTFHCKIFERKSSAQAGANGLLSFDDKFWMCTDAPGRLVKYHFEHTSARGTTISDGIVTKIVTK